MQLQYKHQSFQEEAARSVVRAFQGQPKYDRYEHQMDQGEYAASLVSTGFGNAPLQIPHETIRNNVRTIQIEQGIKPIDQLEGEGINLTIEMETGTGKTYTYIKTMYELNKAYGWSKFIIVVPSVAIREGVAKSFESMSEHFAQLYETQSIQHFVYNSKQLARIDTFASDSNMQAMIINMQAFNSSFDETKNNKDARIIFSRRDEFGSRRPIDILAKTNPIMIIDEPQSVLGADRRNKTREGIKLFNPLMLLRYSATHREVLNMVYRLDAIDAYNKRLVKKIQVKGISQIGNNATGGYLYLEEVVVRKDRAPEARISLNIKTATGTRPVSRLVRPGDNLYELSGGLAEYQDLYVIESIDGYSRTIRLLNDVELHEGDAEGQVTEEAMRRVQIRETIRTHLERERELYPKGIKVLSLFFIDHVDNYRCYEGDATKKGRYATIFEEEYSQLVQELKDDELSQYDASYRDYLSRFTAEEVHNGYFSQDKRGKFIDSKVNRSEGGSNDEDAYDLIMKNKERLLSLEEPTRFIFSHSALREGWDNPNVFQICTLRDTDNEIKKRQEVGRGMRLCVNSEGKRQDAEELGWSSTFDINVLTVIASQSYESFARELQHEIAEVVKDRPREVTEGLFTGVEYETASGDKEVITPEVARKIYRALLRHDYVDDAGLLTQAYHEAKERGELSFGDDLAPMSAVIIRTLERVFDPSSWRLDNSRENKSGHVVEEQLKRREFQELWRRINVRSVYQVDFDTSELITKAITALDDRLRVTAIRLVVERGEMNQIEDVEALHQGTAMVREQTTTYHLQETVSQHVQYDLVGSLVSATGLTRRTIVEILKGVRRETFDKFKSNPEEFIQRSARIIKDEMALAVVEQISYHRTKQRYDTNIFTEETICGRIGVDVIRSAKSLYDLVRIDSQVERSFAEDLEDSSDVVVYTKLPKGFYINTPMGKYSPDWAIAFDEHKDVKHIYFVAETKGTSWERSELRGAEDAKLECAARHFKAISEHDNVVYDVVNSYQALMDKVMEG